MNNRKTEILLLLRDYMNFLPPGQQEAFVPAYMVFGNTSSWPITSELEKRMDTSTLVGDTYHKLDTALLKLNEEYPELYNVVLSLYLREDCGHRDIDHVKRLAQGGSNNALDFLVLHDKAIEELDSYLHGQDLYVRWPHKATGPRPGQDMQQRHDELFAIFWRNYESGEGTLPYRQALSNAVFKMKDYYSRRHADRIVKGKLKAMDESA